MPEVNHLILNDVFICILVQLLTDFPLSRVQTEMYNALSTLHITFVIPHLYICFHISLAVSISVFLQPPPPQAVNSHSE